MFKETTQKGDPPTGDPPLPSLFREGVLLE